LIRLLGRVTALSVPAFALVNGSAVAAGCMLAFSHDEIYVYDKAVFYCN
jgi:enoyl-CoA hydratase/carnithine racemase